MSRAKESNAAARHAEVARRYAWREAKGRIRAPDWLAALNHVRELRRFMSHRYGENIPEDDAGLRGGLVKLKADTIARRIGRTYADRTLLKSKTIGCCDLTRAERYRARRHRRSEAKRERRRQRGIMTRDRYEANGRAMRAEAEALGISYEALRKRFQRAGMTRVSQVRGNRIREIFSARRILGTRQDKRLKALPLFRTRQHLL